MTLDLELPDAWKQLLGLDTADAAGRAREMLVIESYREGKLSIQLASLRALQFRNIEKEEPPFSIPGSCPGLLRIAAIEHDGATGFREPVKALS